MNYWIHSFIFFWEPWPPSTYMHTLLLSINPINIKFLKVKILHAGPLMYENTSACVFYPSRLFILPLHLPVFPQTLQNARGFSGIWKDFKNKSFSFEEQVASTNNPSTTLCVYCANIWKIPHLKPVLPPELNKTNGSSRKLFTFKLLVMT